MSIVERSIVYRCDRCRRTWDSETSVGYEASNKADNAGWLNLNIMGSYTEVFSYPKVDLCARCVADLREFLGYEKPC